MLPTFTGAHQDARATLLTTVGQIRRPLLLGEAPRVRGAPAFANGTVARTGLAQLFRIPDEELELWMELDNVLDEPQPRQGRGRAFDNARATLSLQDMQETDRFNGRDVIFGSWRLAQCAAKRGLPVPAVPAAFSDITRQQARFAWIAHAADTAGVYAKFTYRTEAVSTLIDQMRGLTGLHPGKQESQGRLHLDTSRNPWL